MRRVIPAPVVGATTVASLVSAGAASADGPVITPVSRVVTTPIPSGASWGAFQVLFTVDAEGTDIDFYDGQNELTREIRHVAFTGTLYNSGDLSKSVPYDGHFTRVFDATTNTFTLTGSATKCGFPARALSHSTPVGRSSTRLPAT
jgi:hypothetical protein